MELCFEFDRRVINKAKHQDFRASVADQTWEGDWETFPEYICGLARYFHDYPGQGSGGWGVGGVGVGRTGPESAWKQDLEQGFFP